MPRFVYKRMMRKSNLFFAVLLLAGFASAQNPGHITGSLQTATSGTINNGTLTFTLSQPSVVAGTASLVTQPVACYTSNAGSIVGVPDPVIRAILSTNTVSGTLPAATYFVEIYYTGPNGTVSAVSPEASVVLSAQGTVIVQPPAFGPTNATGYGVAISTSSGTETIQGTVSGFASQFQQSTPLTAGSTPALTNNSVCNLFLSDELIPTGTYYSVNLLNKNGSPIAGFPQSWCTYGGSGATINVSQGAPTGNCNVSGVYYPTPIFSSLATGASQNISTPMTFNAPSTMPSLNGIIHLDGVKYPSLATAAAACPISGTLIVDTPGTWTVSSNLTIPATCKLQVEQGALLSPNTGVTLTVNGPFIAGHYQIAATGYAGTINIQNVPVYYAEWAPGANACRQILATWALMPSNGTRGIVDARAFPSLNQTCDINPFPAAAPGGKLLLGNQTWQTTATWSMVQGQSIEGMSWGSNGFGLTLIQAVTGFSTGGAAVLQSSNDSTNNQHIAHLAVDCNGIANATGIFVRDSQENTVVEDYQITGCPANGLQIGTGAAGTAQNSGTFRQGFITNGLAGPSCPAAMLGVFVNVSSTAFRGVKDLTVDFRGCTTTHPNVDMQVNSPGSFQDIHLEGATTGLQIGGGPGFYSDISCQLSGSTVATCVVAASGSIGSEINNVICACTTNILSDTVNSVAFATATYGNQVPHYTVTGTTSFGPDSFGWISLPETASLGVASAANVDSLFGNSILHGILSEINNSVSVPIGTSTVLTADWTCGTGGTVSSCASATIIGTAAVAWAFNLPSGIGGVNMQLDCDGIVAQATALTSNQWNLVTNTQGATNITAYYFFPTNGAAAPTLASNTYTTDQGSTTTTFQIGGNWTLGALVGAAKYPFHIHAAIRGASTSGVTQLGVQLVAPTPADLVTIYQGSGCWIHP